MNRSINFENIEKLIDCTALYFFENEIIELDSNWRKKESHISKITSLYFDKRPFDKRACLDFYIKWKYDRNLFKSKVLARLEALKSSKEVNEKNKDYIYLSSEEWKRLISFTTNGPRPKLKSCSITIFNEKFREIGFCCQFKIEKNYFSTAKKQNKKRIFWNAVFRCIICENSVHANLQNKPLGSAKVFIELEIQKKSCIGIQKEIKIRLLSEERDLFKQEIALKGATNFKTEATFTGDVRKLGLSSTTIRKLKSEYRHRFQLHNDFRIDADTAKLMFDYFLKNSKSRRLEGYIQEIHSNPFGVLLISEIQIKMWSLISENNSIWYFDATGCLMPKFRSQQETLLYTFVSHDLIRKKLLPVADFLSSANDTITIGSSISKILQMYAGYYFFKHPKIVITDFSWANIHALMNSFNKIDVISYLFLTYRFIVKKEAHAISSLNSIIYICSTHFLKNVVEDVDKELLNIKNEKFRHKIKQVFVLSFVLLQNSTDFNEFCENLICVKKIFDMKYKTSDFEKVIIKLDKNLAFRNIDWLKNICNDLKNSNVDKKPIFFISNSNINYSEDSPFTGYFRDLFAKLEENDVIPSDVPNNFFFPNLFGIIKKKLHLLPFWSGLLLHNFGTKKTRLSNNSVEQWFFYFKNKILDVNKRVKYYRLLYTSEIATPLYFYLNHNFKYFYEDHFNMKYQSFEANNMFLNSKIEKEMWALKKPLKPKPKYNTKTIDLSFMKTGLFEQKVDQKLISDIEIEEQMEWENQKESKEEILHGKNLVKNNFNEETKFLIYYKVDELKIRQSDIRRLLNNEWLNDELIQMFAVCVIKQSKKKIFLFDSRFITEVLTKKNFMQNTFNFNNFTELYGFVNENNDHWTLIFINIKQKQFSYLNSFGENSLIKNKFFNNWKEFCMNYGYFKEIKWTLFDIKHPIQHDSINCGVFACYFLKCLVQDKKVNFESKKEDLFNYRLEINNLIKQFSNRNFCSYCGNNLNANELSLKTDCQHRYHLSCLSSTENDLFSCPLCF